MKPKEKGFTKGEANCPQEDQHSQNHIHLSHESPSVRESINSHEETTDSYRAQHETDIQHQDHVASGNRQIDHSSPFLRERHLHNNFFSNDEESYQNIYLNILSQSNIFDNNVGALFHVNQSNTTARVTNQTHPMHFQPSLRHDQLYNDFLNRELLDFDIDLLESNEELTPNTRVSHNFTEISERELEQLNEAIQFFSTRDEGDSINEYHFSINSIYIDDSNQISDVHHSEQLELTEHSDEFLSLFYENSMEFDESTESKDVWKERGDGPLNQLKNNEYYKNSFITFLNENRTLSPFEIITPEITRQRFPSGANEELGGSGIEDVTVNNLKNKFVDNNSTKVTEGPVVFDNLEEALFYESRIKETDAKDSAIYSVEQRVKKDSNCYDLDCVSAKDFGTVSYKEYNIAGTESFVPETMNIIVMPLRIQPDNETKEPEEGSQTLSQAGELEGSNIPETSTTFETESYQETSSQRERDQTSDAAAPSSVVLSSTSGSQAQPVVPSSTSAYNLQVSDIQKETSEDVSNKGVKFESRPDYSENMQIITPAIESVIPETGDITIQQPVISTEDLLPTETEVQEKFEKNDCKGELLTSNIFDFSNNLQTPLVKTGTQRESQDEQIFNKEPSNSSSNELSSAPLLQEELFSSVSVFIRGDDTPGMESEGEHGGASIASAEPTLSDETQTLAPDSESIQVFAENDSNIVQETTAIDNREYEKPQQSEIRENENIPVDSNVDDLNNSSNSIKEDVTKITQSDDDTACVSQLSPTPPELKLPPDKKVQVTIDIENPAGEFSVTSTLGETGSQREKKLDTSPKEEILNVVLSIDPYSLPQMQNPQSSSSFYSNQGDNVPEKVSEGEHGGTSIESVLKDNQVVIGNDPVVEETNIIDNAKENSIQNRKAEDKIEVALASEVMKEHMDSGGGTGTSIQTDSKTEIEQPPTEVSLTEVSSIEPSLETQTQHISTSNELGDQVTMHDSIVINISPSELAWLSSEPAAQGDMESHPCFDQLENYQIEQVTLSIEGMLQAPMPGTPPNQETSDDLSGQIYSEQIGESTLPPVTAKIKENLTPDRSEIEQVSSEAELPPVTSGVPSPEKLLVCPSAHEPIIISFESEPSAQSHSGPSIESVSSTSKPTTSVEKDSQAIADDPSDDDAPLAKRKRTASKSNMKLRVKETRKSSRVRRNPERLFYIEKGQLF